MARRNLGSEISDEQAAEFIARLGRFGLTEADFLRLLEEEEWMEWWVKERLNHVMGRLETVTVRDLCASDVYRMAEVRFRNSNPDFYHLDFVRDERGKKFEIRRWKAKLADTTEDYVNPQTLVTHLFRERFTSRGFVGNTAAFISLTLQGLGPCGSYMTIPEDEQLLRKDGQLYAPYYSLTASERRGRTDRDVDTSGHYLGFQEVSRPWKAGQVNGVTFVAFREVKT